MKKARLIIIFPLPSLPPGKHGSLPFDIVDDIIKKRLGPAASVELVEIIEDSS